MKSIDFKLLSFKGSSATTPAYEEGLTVEKGLQLVTQLNLLVEASSIYSYIQDELPTQADQPAKRALPRCSACREISHRINSCKNRYI